MLARIATASVGVPVLVLLVWVGSYWFTCAVALAAVLGALEMCGLARRWGDRPVVVLAAAAAAALVFAGHWLGGMDGGGRGAALVVAAAALLSVALVVWRHGSGTRLSGLAVTAAAALYTGGLLLHAPLLRALDNGMEWVLLLLLTTFANDTASLFVGRLMGRRRLAPSISPSKTVEGSVGGILAALAVSVTAFRMFDLDVTAVEALGTGLLIAVVGQLGDLVESRLKRQAGADNSGRLLPGHGGMLDRLDSIVFNLAVVYHLAVLL